MTYAASLSGAFVYEDTRDTQPLALTAVPWPPTPRWLTSASYAVTSALWDTSPRAARTVSLAWHLANGLLLGLLARRVLPATGAVVAVGVFLLVPIQTEAVAAVAYRSELVAATWLLLALLCVSRGWVVAAWVCAVVTVTGKEAGLIALALVPCWAWWMGPRWSRRQALGWALASLVPLWQLVAWFQVHSVPLFWPVSEMAIAAATAGRLVGLAVLSLVQPGVLTIDHDWGHLTPAMGFGTLGCWALLIAFASGVGRLALVWIGVALSLRVVLTLPELHEHHVYSALLLPALAVGAWTTTKGQFA